MHRKTAGDFLKVCYSEIFVEPTFVQLRLYCMSAAAAAVACLPSATLQVDSTRSLGPIHVALYLSIFACHSGPQRRRPLSVETYHACVPSNTCALCFPPRRRDEERGFHARRFSLQEAIHIMQRGRKESMGRVVVPT